MIERIKRLSLPARDKLTQLITADKQKHAWVGMDTDTKAAVQDIYCRHVWEFGVPIEVDALARVFDRPLIATYIAFDALTLEVQGKLRYHPKVVKEVARLLNTKWTAAELLKYLE